MSLLEKFYDYTKKNGFDKSDIYEEKDQEYTLLSFFEKGKNDVLFNVALVFYEDDNAEVYIRSAINNYDMLSVLEKINELNSKYCGVTFLIADDMLVVKSYCKANGELDILLREMVQNMKIAQKEFCCF